MSETAFPTRVAPVENLPPAEFWLADPNKKLQTPTDGRGLVIVDELIEGVKAYIDPSFVWDDKPDVHHLYWPRETYEALEAWSKGYIRSRLFREVCANKIYVPRSFHEVLHTVTVPPAMPSPEVMRYYSEGWRVARSLFTSVKEVVRAERLNRRRLEREDLTAEEERVGRLVMEESLRRHFKGVQRHLGELCLVPREFWPLDPNLPTQLAAGQIGEPVLRGSQRQVKAVRRPLAA